MDMRTDPRPPTTAAALAPDARVAARHFDRTIAVATAGLTAGLSPASLTLAWTDWAMQWLLHPAHSGQLLADACATAAARVRDALAGAAPEFGDDPRFAGADWHAWPWRLAAQTQLDAERWWQRAAQLPAMEPHHRRQVRFLARQALEAVSPANHGWMRPDVLRLTHERGGRNLGAGGQRLQAAWLERLGVPPATAEPVFEPGRDVAITPGRVVHRNHLAELIQYAPTTDTVHAEPVFIVPSWIMKYYVLDLTPPSSLVRWLVSQGHTVFILSWRNPDEGDALLSMQDYLDLGVLEMLAAIGARVPGEPVHLAGYCLGGTLAAIAAASLSRPDAPLADRLPALASLTLLAAETDFAEPGEMGVLIDEAQVSLLEDLMAERGYLTGRQMAGSFTFLHARELFWARTLKTGWLGEDEVPNELMAWNADRTRMPAVMHGEYLRRCFLHNELALGRFPVDGRPVSLGDLHRPIFAVGTETDHVAPWRSVHAIHRLTDAPVTFALASGGHNAGIVSPPTKAGRRHAIATRPRGGHADDPDTWLDAAERREGSWWPSWSRWLVDHGSGRRDAARAVPDDAPAAPGDHVHVRYDD